MLNDRFKILLAKELSAEISADERREFLQILQNDSQCRAEYELFKSYWQEVDESSSDDGLLFEKVKNKIALLEVAQADSAIQEAASVRSERFRWLKMAAILTVILAAALLLFNKQMPGDDLRQIVKTTPNGVRSRITLPDGTMVTLNSGSRLEYANRFAGPNREVRLSGEAFFEVKKDVRHPFIVHTEKMDVKVLGTAFNVKTYPDDRTTETTLIRGSVQINVLDRPADAIILKPNEKFIIQNQAAIKARVQSENKNEITPAQYTLTTLSYFEKKGETIIETSWLDNKLAFNNEDFLAVSHKMERWYGVDIQFASQKISKYRFTALFEKESLTEALNALQMTEDFRYKVENNSVYIY